MQLTDILKEEFIIPQLTSQEKEAVLRELVHALAGCVDKPSENRIVHVLSEREKLGSTGIGNGVAIPHGKMRDLDRMLVVFGRTHEGVAFDSLDGKPVHLLFALVAPENSSGLHLKVLAKISKLLKNKEVRTGLMEAPSREAIFEIICGYDEEF